MRETSSYAIKEAEKVATTIAESVNSMGLDYECIATALASQHRTLQQSFTRLCVAWIRQLAEMKKGGWHDLRNEASVNLAERIAPLLKDTYLPFI